MLILGFTNAEVTLQVQNAEADGGLAGAVLMQDMVYIKYHDVTMRKATSALYWMRKAMSALYWIVKGDVPLCKWPSLQNLFSQLGVDIVITAPTCRQCQIQQ